MSRTFSVACDFCHQAIESDWGWGGGWVEVSAGRGSTKWDFCSWGCLLSYARDMAAKAGSDA